MPEQRRGWVPKDIQYIKDNYGKMSLHELSSNLGRSYSSISSKIYKLGLDDPKCWTTEEDKILVDNYEFNPTVWGLIPNRSRTAIKLRAERSFRLKRRCGNYPINFRFFDDITSECAYVLGFFTADGCVEPKLNRISFSQRNEDVDVLYKVRSAMGCHNPLCFKKTRNEVGLYIHNEHMVKSLTDLGYTSDKTYKADIPDKLDTKYYLSFIRGLIDGDGSVMFKNNRGVIQLLGTFKVLTKIRHFLITQGISSRPNVNKRIVNVWSLKYGGQDDVLSICNLVYSGNKDLSLIRKYNKAMDILNFHKGAFARGGIPGKINQAQNEETLLSNVKGNLVGKSVVTNDVLACRDYTLGSANADDGIVRPCQ